MPVTTKPPGTQPPAAIRAVSRPLVRNVHAPFAARRFVRIQLRAWRLPGLLDTTELIADELAANAYEHGSGDFIGIGLELSRAHVTVKVWDADGDQMPAPPDPAATYLDEHGRGLLLTEALSVRWGAYPATTGGKVVWATCC